MERYQDKVVLITGAGDVAEAAAKRLLCEGAKVAFSDFSQEALDAAISGLKAEGWDGERLMGIKCDVRKYEECEAAANAVLARWGQIDTLVATAGIIRHCPIDEMTEAQWQDVVDINLTGVFHAVKSVVPSMKERKYGHIVVISSIGGRTGRPGVGVNYAATKAGVNGLVMCLGYDPGPYRIPVRRYPPPEDGRTERRGRRHRLSGQRRRRLDHRRGAGCERRPPVLRPADPLCKSRENGADP